MLRRQNLHHLQQERLKFMKPGEFFYMYYNFCIIALQTLNHFHTNLLYTDDTRFLNVLQFFSHHACIQPLFMDAITVTIKYDDHFYGRPQKPQTCRNCYLHFHLPSVHDIFIATSKATTISTLQLATLYQFSLLVKQSSFSQLHPQFYRLGRTWIEISPVTSLEYCQWKFFHCLFPWQNNSNSSSSLVLL